MRMPKCVRYLILKHRIKSQLPRFHPETGQKLAWVISFKYMNPRFDSRSGIRTSGFPSLYISQSRHIPGYDDYSCYEFDWKGQKIIKTGLEWA